MATTKKAKPAPVTNALTESVEVLRALFKSKKMSDPFVTLDEDDFMQSLPHIPTGSIMLDYLMGGKLNQYGVPPCPGFPKGKVINLYGQESSGKTTVALMVAANVIAAGGTVLYIDWENAIVPAYAKTLGVPINDKIHFMLSQPDTLEQGISSIWVVVNRGIDLVVIDSVGAGVPKAVMEQALDEKGAAGRVGASAQIWSTMLPQIRSKIIKTGTCVVGISQLRSTINTSGYGDATSSQAQGGNAWKFYSDIRFGLRRIKTEKSKEYDVMAHSSSEEVTTGAKVRARADKCKVSAMQGREVEFYLKHGEGVDDLRSVIEFAQRHGIVKKDGSWYGWEKADGSSIRLQGREAFQEAVRSNPDAAAELRRLTISRLYASDACVPEDDKGVEEEALDIESILSAGELPAKGAKAVPDGEEEA